MKYPFKNKEESLKDYIYSLKEACIIEHEDNWFKEKSHTRLYPNLDEAKGKVSKPHYWILNAIDKFEDEECEDKEKALCELAQLTFKTNYYSHKLTSENENENAKRDLANLLCNLEIPLEKIVEQMMSMDTPKYARLEISKEESLVLVSSWL